MEFLKKEGIPGVRKRQWKRHVLQIILNLRRRERGLQRRVLSRSNTVIVRLHGSCRLIMALSTGKKSCVIKNQKSADHDIGQRVTKYDILVII